AENALKENLKSHQADHGSAILMEVSTGEIKAIANLKRDTTTGEYYEAYNYAIGENTEPGSTFKIASLMVGLEDNKFDLTDSVDTEGGETEFFGQVMEDSHEGGYGVITVEEALELSSNVAVSKLIYQSYASDPEKFIAGLKDMGLGSPTGIKMIGEVDPLIKGPQSSTWSKVTLPWMSIGYEVELTPLQILTFYNAIANDGRMMQPMLVKEVRSAGKTTEHVEPVVLNSSIASQKTIRKAQKMLQGVVEEGTAKNLFNTVYKIAGKTGTAQIAKGIQGYDFTGHKASFVGYFPADNPRYTCAVVVNKPSRGLYYGGSVAAPVFKEIADKVYATQLDMQESKIDSSGSLNMDLIAGNKKDFNLISERIKFPARFMDPASEFVSPEIISESVNMKPVKIKSGYVPDVRGMGARDAVYLLKREGLDVKMEGRGKVVSQSVTPGTRVVKGRKIKIELNV
ncbi:MAG: penicillin-binding protein, partial [Bacteroidales bacterium]